MLLHRKKRHAHGVMAGLGQSESKLGAFAREECMRNLNQNARAIPGFRVASAGTTMSQVQQNLNALADNVVTLMAADAGDKANAASIVLVRRVIEALSGGQSGSCISRRQFSFFLSFGLLCAIQIVQTEKERREHR